jgi:hypothetical protein
MKSVYLFFSNPILGFEDKSFRNPGTEKPLISHRKSKYLYSLAGVSHERRDGYGWYTYAPREVLNQYPEWQKKWGTHKK